MNFLECLNISVSSILSNKLRSFLTMLGIIIGISSVIAIAAIGEGGKSYISGQFEKFGVNVVEIKLGDSNTNTRDFFTLDDIEDIKQKIPDIKAAAPIINTMGVIKGDEVSKDAFIIGTNGDYGVIFNAEMLYGRFINDRDVQVGKNVVVIDDVAAKKVFGYCDCVGQRIKVGGRLTQVSAVICGVMKSNVEIIEGVAGDSIPLFAYMPVTFMKKGSPDDFAISQIEIGLQNHLNADYVIKDAIRLLERAHNNKGKYIAQNLLNQLDTITDILDKFTLIISAIAAISLIVGGIGVMNIMLVSVTERTREIGIRKALGATRRNILIQFLTESLIISLIGGIIGLIVGFSCSLFVGSALGLNTYLYPWIILLVVGLTSMVGIFFGIYPASKAAKLNPIEALRYE